MSPDRKITVRLSKAELLALGGAAIVAACQNTAIDEFTDQDRSILLDLNSKALQLLQTCGIDPTGIKDLGLSMVGMATRS